MSLRIDEGAAGYGIYWMILELLRDAPGYRVTNYPKAIAFAINEPDIDLVARVLARDGLFTMDDSGQVYSPWLLEQMEAYDERKKKLQEAGRKGAAIRFHGTAKENSEPLATLFDTGGHPIAYNATQSDITKQNPTPSIGQNWGGWRDICDHPGERVSPELLDTLCKTQPDGHAPGYIAQVCIRYGMGENVLNFLCELTNNADLTNDTYIKFCAIVRRVEGQKWHPEHPANFFLSKLLA